jgi:hypothetical protein
MVRVGGPGTMMAVEVLSWMVFSRVLMVSGYVV